MKPIKGENRYCIKKEILKGEDRYCMKDAFSIPEIKNNQEESFEPYISSQHLDMSNNRLALEMEISQII